jgi:hypothetical protein
VAAAHKKDPFLFKRPPRADSFMRWLGLIAKGNARGKVGIRLVDECLGADNSKHNTFVALIEAIGRIGSHDSLPHGVLKVAAFTAGCHDDRIFGLKELDRSHVEAGLKAAGTRSPAMNGDGATAQELAGGFDEPGVRVL